MYLCGENSSISIVGESSFLSLDVEKIKTAPAAKQALQTYGLLTSGTIEQMKERLWQHKNRVKDDYAAKRFQSTTIYFGAKTLMNNHSLRRYVLLTAAYCMQHVPQEVLLLLSLLLKMALGCAAHFSVLSRMTKAGVLSIACVSFALP